MVVNKTRLYWLMQIGGWALYAAVQIGVALVSVGTISTQRVIFLTYEAFFCFILTHLFRTYMNNNRWLSCGHAPTYSSGAVGSCGYWVW
ncbi:MAG: hypothetical protein U5K54_16055 [Cytophagales bacterium]|nr:hypothetical protein [Cytophagales bacterium]